MQVCVFSAVLLAVPPSLLCFLRHVLIYRNFNFETSDFIAANVNNYCGVHSNSI